MRVYRQPEAFSAEAAGTVVSAGNFDGVHCAHRSILAEAVADARCRGAWAVALSFDPHPAHILHPDTAPPLLTDTPEKIHLLSELGLDALLLLPFTRDLSLMPPRQFVAELLLRQLRMRSLHEGADFRFGHRHAGNVESLRLWSQEFGFDLKVHTPITFRGQVISSSRIRQLLAEGRIGLARRLLGRSYSLQGAIIAGRGIGRRETVPTLNLQPSPLRLLPARGVYVTRCRIAGRRFHAVTNVGLRPTFADTPPSPAIETHLLDQQPPPAENMQVEFLFRLRPEIAFPHAAALKAQILDDAARARRAFAHLAACGLDE